VVFFVAKHEISTLKQQQIVWKISILAPELLKIGFP
jgi:hypothetical protein